MAVREVSTIDALISAIAFTGLAVVPPVFVSKWLGTASTVPPWAISIVFAVSVIGISIEREARVTRAAIDDRLDALTVAVEALAENGRRTIADDFDDDDPGADD